MNYTPLRKLAYHVLMCMLSLHNLEANALEVFYKLVFEVALYDESTSYILYFSDSHDYL